MDKNGSTNSQHIFHPTSLMSHPLGPHHALYHHAHYLYRSCCQDSMFPPSDAYFAAAAAAQFKSPFQAAFEELGSRSSSFPLILPTAASVSSFLPHAPSPSRSPQIFYPNVGRVRLEGNHTEYNFSGSEIRSNATFQTSIHERFGPHQPGLVAYPSLAASSGLSPHQTPTQASPSPFFPHFFPEFPQFYNPSSSSLWGNCVPHPTPVPHPHEKSRRDHEDEQQQRLPSPEHNVVFNGINSSATSSTVELASPGTSSSIENAFPETKFAQTVSHASEAVIPHKKSKGNPQDEQRLPSPVHIVVPNSIHPCATSSATKLASPKTPSAIELAVSETKCVQTVSRTNDAVIPHKKSRRDQDEEQQQLPSPVHTVSNSKQLPATPPAIELASPKTSSDIEVTVPETKCAPAVFHANGAASPHKSRGNQEDELKSKKETKKQEKEERKKKKSEKKKEKRKKEQDQKHEKKRKKKKKKEKEKESEEKKELVKGQKTNGKQKQEQESERKGKPPACSASLHTTLQTPSTSRDGNDEQSSKKRTQEENMSCPKATARKPVSGTRRRRFRSGMDMIRQGQRKKKARTSETCSSKTIQETNEQRTGSSSTAATGLVCETRKLMANKASGETVLHRAARQGYTDVVVSCLETGSCDINARDFAGYTPLHECCSSGHLEIARILLRHGADANACAARGIRVLHDAIECDHLQVVRLLLSYGADPSICTYKGTTPLELAKSKSMLQLLRGFMSDLNGSEDGEKEPVLAWKFSHYDPKAKQSDNGFDVFAEPPPEPDSDCEPETGDLIIEESDRPMCDSFTLHRQSGEPVKVVRLRDVLTHLEMDRSDFCSKHRRVERFLVPEEEFECKATCNQLPGSRYGRKINPESGCKVELVRLDDDVRKILGIERTRVR